VQKEQRTKLEFFKPCSPCLQSAGKRRDFGRAAEGTDVPTYIKVLVGFFLFSKHGHRNDNKPLQFGLTCPTQVYWGQQMSPKKVEGSCHQHLRAKGRTDTSMLALAGNPVCDSGSTVFIHKPRTWLSKPPSVHETMHGGANFGTNGPVTSSVNLARNGYQGKGHYAPRRGAPYHPPKNPSKILLGVEQLLRPITLDSR